MKWDKVAEATGLKNGKVALARFGQIKKRIGWDSAAGSNSSTGPIMPSKVTKPRGPGRAKAGKLALVKSEDQVDADVDDEHDESQGSARPQEKKPAKKQQQKKRQQKQKPVVEQELITVVDHEEDQEDHLELEYGKKEEQEGVVVGNE